MGHSFDMLIFDFLLKPPQPFTGLFLHLCHRKSVILDFYFLSAMFVYKLHFLSAILVLQFHPTLTI